MTIKIKVSHSGSEPVPVSVEENSTIANSLPAIFSSVGIPYNSKTNNEYSVIYSGRRLNDSLNINKTFKELNVKNNRKINIVDIANLIMSKKHK